MKQCKLCDIEKPLNEYRFRKSLGKHDGSCKECRKEQRRAYHIKNKEKNVDFTIIGNNFQHNQPIVVILESGVSEESIQSAAAQLGIDPKNLYTISPQQEFINERNIFEHLESLIKSQPELSKYYQRNMKIYAGRDSELDRLFALLAKRIPEQWKGYVQIQTLDVLHSLIESLIAVSVMQKTLSRAA